MDPTSALEVLAVRAVETADGARALWGDADRAWASRAAAEVVGADAAPETFLARRAALALERLGARQPALPRAVRALRWRPWVGTAAVGFAFALGVFVDQVGGAQRINILAPPVFGLLLWNLAVYAVMAVGFVVRHGEPGRVGPVRGALARMAGGLAPPRRGGALHAAILAFLDDWIRRSAPLYAVRAARMLHFAAAALAAGVIVGMYVRGLAFEYRASWASTFLDAPAVRSIVAVAYAPGAYLTGIPVPAGDAVAAIRAPGDENAARWLHLMAATLAAVVIAPRLALALVAALIERHRAARVPLDLDEPYFLRLLRGFRGGPARVRVMPYSYAPSAAALAGIEAVIARAFGGSAALIVAAPVGYGDEEAPGAQVQAAAGTSLVALFNAAATPEREAHGAFLAALARQRGSGETLLAIVDEGPLAARFGNEPARIAERRAAWRHLAEEAGVPAAFIDLSAPDLAAAEAGLDAAIAGRAS